MRCRRKVKSNNSLSSKTKSWTEKNTLSIPQTNTGISPIIRNASSYNKIRQQYGLTDDD